MFREGKAVVDPANADAGPDGSEVLVVVVEVEADENGLRNAENDLKRDGRGGEGSEGGRASTAGPMVGDRDEEQRRRENEEVVGSKEMRARRSRRSIYDQRALVLHRAFDPQPPRAKQMSHKQPWPSVDSPIRLVSSANINAQSRACA